jgi:diguanylate cyclase (GGDEF)-like protein
MAAPHLTEQVRRRLVALIAEDRPDSERLMARLREIRNLEGIATCSSLVYLLANLSVREEEAERLLDGLLRHRDELRSKLGRDPGLRVAAIDYLTNVRQMMNNPTIVELSQLRRTERSAITDHLTGMYNRRYFQSAIEVEIRRSRRYVLPLSLLMLDLDAFKSVNDVYGHPFGDLVLQVVGQVMRRAVRDSDLACRVGGEEFAVILPETDRLGAYAVAERIRLRIAKTFAEKPVGGRAVAMTVSGGIASYPADGDEADELVRRADRALYQSKMRGRNRVILYHSERRRAVRFPVRARARVQLSADVYDEPRTVRPVNLSTGGILVELKEDVLPEGHVRLTLERRGGPGRVERLETSGRVVRVEASRDGGPARVAVAFERPVQEQQLLRHVTVSRLSRPVEGDAP